MRQTDSLFPRELSGLLKRAGAVTATALLVLAMVLAGSASFDPSLGRERPALPDPALAAGQALPSPAPGNGVV